MRISAIWPDKPAEAQQRARAFLWLRLGLAAVVVAVGCLAAGPLAQRVLNTDAGLLRWALLGVVATAASGAMSAMLQATGAFGRMSSLTLFNTGLTALLAVGLGWLTRLDLLAALVVLGIGTSLATFLLGRWMLPWGWSLNRLRPAELRSEARHLLRTGRWLWLAVYPPRQAGLVQAIHDRRRVADRSGLERSAVAPPQRLVGNAARHPLDPAPTSLANVTDPRCSPAISRTMESPSPVPGTPASCTRGMR